MTIKFYLAMDKANKHQEKSIQLNLFDVRE